MTSVVLELAAEDSFANENLADNILPNLIVLVVVVNSTLNCFVVMVEKYWYYEYRSVNYIQWHYWHHFLDYDVLLLMSKTKKNYIF